MAEPDSANRAASMSINPAPLFVLLESSPFGASVSAPSGFPPAALFPFSLGIQSQ